jgi:anti-sigma factor RsiW
MRRLGEGIREAVPRPLAPLELRDRLFRSIARARTGGAGLRRGHSRRRLGAAVVAALLLGGAWLGWRAASGPSLRPDALGAIAEDHLRTERSAGLISSDSVEVVRWLRERLPFGVEVPLFPGARLTGARLLLVGGQSGAVVEYTIAGRPLSYYVLSGVTEAAAEPRRVSLASRAGYRIASWEDAGLTHALVAGLPGPKLVELAHYCIEQMTPATEV